MLAWRGVHEQEREKDEHRVDDRLLAWTEVAIGPVSVGIASEQDGLEEEEASGPNRGSAAEPGKNALRDQRLDLEKKKGTNEDCRGVDEREPAIARGGHAM